LIQKEPDHPRMVVFPVSKAVYFPMLTDPRILKRLVY
jgi:hypothetical protein